MNECSTTCPCMRLLGPLIVAAFILMFAMAFFDKQTESQVSSEPASSVMASLATADSSEPLQFKKARARMIRDNLAGRDIRDERVLEAMARVPRQKFLPGRLVADAYRDGPLPIGHGQTISQPYIVALMTQLAQPKPTSRALDIGTGSGYQAAILSELCQEVYSIEIVKPLADSAIKRLAELGYANVTVHHGDGYRGWKEHAPYDLIIVAAAPDHVPEALVEQLAPGGRLVMPVGHFFQDLLLIEKKADGSITRRNIAPVAFVPMTGEAEKNQ